jgi:hypothetical protein
MKTRKREKKKGGAAENTRKIKRGFFGPIQNSS